MSSAYYVCIAPYLSLLSIYKSMQIKTNYPMDKDFITDQDFLIDNDKKDYTLKDSAFTLILNSDLEPISLTLNIFISNNPYNPSWVKDTEVIYNTSGLRFNCSSGR